MPSFKRLLGLKWKKDKKHSKVAPQHREEDQETSAAARNGHLGRVFRELDCPVCFNTCIPPIHSCVNGHIICNMCRTNLKQCPSCRQGFSGTRNFFAENFIANCSQTCRYSKEGCEFIRLKGDNMRPHEQNCLFRPLQCIYTPCGQEIAYKSLLSHLIMTHQVEGTDQVPANITYDVAGPLIDSRKWSPYYIQAYDNVFYVMMEIIRPNFWIWVWVQAHKAEDPESSLFISTITMEHYDKKQKLLWEGPVHSIRTPESIIVTDGLCFAVPEVLMQHFFINNLFTFQVDVTQVLRLSPKDINDNSGIDVTSATRGSFSRQSSYNRSGLYLIEGDGERTAIDNDALNRNMFFGDVAPVAPNIEPADEYKV